VDITVAIPTIPGRRELLHRAIDSVRAQTHPTKIQVALDTNGEGAAATRNRALAQVDTEWVAFLDDDDELKPHHLKLCARHAVLTGADLVYPGFDGEDDTGMFGVPFDALLLRRRNYIPVTVLVRTDLVRSGFTPHPDEYGNPCEDWGLWLKLLDAGARFSHLPQRTWIRNPGGTRGRPEEG
jgi:glycosyltransferase involved in cell wall biosynthesis